jgi:hypothetical protein
MTALSFEDLAEQDFDLKIAAAVDRAVAAPPNKDAFDCLAGAIIRLFAANTRLSVSCRHLEARLNRLAARVGALEMASLGGRGPDLDRGSEALQERKRRVTGREDLPLDGAAVLYGHDRLDRQRFDTLGMITELLQPVARAWGGKDGSVTGCGWRCWAR